MSLSDEFLENGIIRLWVEDSSSLKKIKDTIGDLILDDLGKSSCLNELHRRDIRDFNDFRLYVINKLNEQERIRAPYFSLAKAALEQIVGNELAMQKNINLSIQRPADDSSLLPIHADTLQGDSPYEVVLWVPLVDCYASKSMFFCNKKVSDDHIKRLGDFKNLNELYKSVEPHLEFMDVKYGEALIFSPNILHGNVVNKTTETRWSLNCRFKSLFSPYSDKKLGEFFVPLGTKPATKLGMFYAG